MSSTTTPLEPVAAIGLLSGPRMLPGTRYQLENLLGDGGAGRVFRGTHVELDRPVAIKVLHQDFGSNSDYSARFRREARAASKIQHPGVVGVTDFGTSDDGRLFLVMELIEGPTLAEGIQAGPMSPKKALRIAANLCDVLAAVHQAGVVHRDIKPANLFMIDDDNVKLVDFGIARMELPDGQDWRITRTGKVVGTPGYMAPEHARAQDVDGRADLYSVGAVLHEMLTGEPPFRGDSPVDVLMAQMATRAPAPSQVLSVQGAGPPQGRKIPRAVDQAVQKLLAMKPVDRYKTAEEAATALREILASMPATTTRLDVSAIERDEEASGRWRVIGAAVIACLLLAAGGAVGFFLLGAIPGPEQQQSGPAASTPDAAGAPSARPVVPSGAAADAGPDGTVAATSDEPARVAPRSASPLETASARESRPQPSPAAVSSPPRASAPATDRAGPGEPASSEPRRATPPAGTQSNSLRRPRGLVEVDEYDRESVGSTRP